MSTSTEDAANLDVVSNASQGAVILIADKFAPSGIETLQSLGHRVVCDPSIDAAGLAEAMTDHDPHVLVVRSTKVRAEAIAAGRRLALVVRAGAGTDNIDVAAASERGVPVANCPGKNAIAVAELAWGLILACDRRIPDQVRDLRAGEWKKKVYAKSSGLADRTLGIVGLGRIGQAIAARGNAFDMRVFAWSRNISDERANAAGAHACENLLNLARMSDVVCVSIAANAETEGLISREFLEAMKPGATLINTSRGSVVDEPALCDVVREKSLRVGLDVYWDEPGSGDATFSPEIANLPGVYGTHHVGASTDQAQEAIATETVRIVREHLERGEVPNCINLADGTGAATLTVRHLNRPGVLAAVCDLLSRNDLNVEDMENVIFTGGAAACARIRLSAMPDDKITRELAERPNVLSVDVTEH